MWIGLIVLCWYFSMENFVLNLCIRLTQEKPYFLWGKQIKFLGCTKHKQKIAIDDFALLSAGWTIAHISSPSLEITNCFAYFERHIE